MPLIQWNHELRFGVPIIDDEHETLIGLLNDLYDAMERGIGQERVKDVFAEVMRYADLHFQHEESLFSTTAYPHKEAHIHEHSRMMQVLMDIRETLNEGRNELAQNALSRMLVDWLIKHTQDMDAGYLPYIKT